MVSTSLLLLGICGLIFVGSWKQTVINMGTAFPATGLPVGIQYATGIVGSIGSIGIALYLIRNIYAVLNGQAEEKDLVTVQGALFMLAVVLMTLVIGTSMDMTPTILILAPVLMPVVKEVGIDPVYFGVVFVMANAIGLITPPVGTSLTAVCGVGKLPVGKVVIGMWPFLLAEIGVLLLLVFIPQIVTIPLAFLTR